MATKGTMAASLLHAHGHGHGILSSASPNRKRDFKKKDRKMTIFPLDKDDLPSYRTSLGFFTALGAGTVVWANLIHNLPFYTSKGPSQGRGSVGR